VRFLLMRYLVRSLPRITRTHFFVTYTVWSGDTLLGESGLETYPASATVRVGTFLPTHAW
jgi:hypothetical protein